MVHLTDHMEGRTCCSLAVCAHFVQRKVILAYCGHTAAHGSNMPQVFRWCLDAVQEISRRHGRRVTGTTAAVPAVRQRTTARG